MSLKVLLLIIPAGKKAMDVGKNILINVYNSFKIIIIMLPIF
jgi:hypothetical protein